MPRNERTSENLVRRQLADLGYRSYESGPFLGTYEEQQSRNTAVDNLLKNASKHGNGGYGRPEFIAHLGSDTLMVVECKASVTDHGNPDLDADHDNPVRYAVDGALHYARFLSARFHVIAVALSGETAATAKQTVYLHRRGAASPTFLLDHDGQAVHDLRSVDNFRALVRFDPQIVQQRETDLKKTAGDLHIFLRNYAALSESEKPLIIAGSLIALMDHEFCEDDPTVTKKQYRKYDESADADKLVVEWGNAIKRVFHDADIPMGKADMVVKAFRAAVDNNPALKTHGFTDKRGHIDERSVLCAILDELETKVSPQVDLHQGFDLVGHFYGEFLRYTAGDKKDLGIVLTPPHITDLFCHIADPNKNSVVIDPCVGTGSFLVSAMAYMSKPRDGVALTDAEKDEIKKHGLIGVEKMPSMFALACANMILRGDGKANMYQGSCFDADIKRSITADPNRKRPTVGMMNPPYAMGKIDAGLTEMRFTENMLDMLAPGSVGIVIVPMSCAIGQKRERADIMSKHTLEAVMQTPSELFYGVGVQTVVMVFTAGRPHPSNKEVWLAQWTDDGFITNRGRKERRPGDWKRVRDRWVADYVNRTIRPGYSFKTCLAADDEWLAVAHMETDYSALTPESFTSVLREFAVFQMMQESAR